MQVEYIPPAAGLHAKMECDMCYRDVIIASLSVVKGNAICTECTTKQALLNLRKCGIF